MSSTLPDSQATGLPGIISVDDHVVEPPRCGRTGCRPACATRVLGSSRPSGGSSRWPRVRPTSRRSWRTGGPATTGSTRTVLVYVHKRHVAIRWTPRRAATCGLRPLEDVHRRPHVRRDAARLLRAEGPRRRPRTGRRRRDPSPSPFPRFCGQTFMEGKGTRSSVWRASGPTTTG